MSEQAKALGQARKHLQIALHLQDPCYVREGARRQIQLATTYLLQNQPEVEHAVALATSAVGTLTGQVDSAHVVSHLTSFIGHRAPYRRRPAVRQLTDRAAHLRTAG